MASEFFEIFGREDISCGTEAVLNQLFDHKYKLWANGQLSYDSIL